MYVTYTRIYGWSDYGGESSYQPGYRLENMMWMTLLVYDYIIPGEETMNMQEKLDQILGKEISQASNEEIYDALLTIVQEMASKKEHCHN